MDRCALCHRKINVEWGSIGSGDLARLLGEHAAGQRLCIGQNARCDTEYSRFLSMISALAKAKMRENAKT